MRGLLIIAIALLLAVWWWRRWYVPSPLEQHYATLEAKQKVGNLAQLAAFAVQPVAAMFGSGWGTTAIINPTNPTYNRPGKTWLNLRFLQPSNSGTGLPRGTSST